MLLNSSSSKESVLVLNLNLLKEKLYVLPEIEHFNAEKKVEKIEIWV